MLFDNWIIYNLLGLTNVWHLIHSQFVFIQKFVYSKSLKPLHYDQDDEEHMKSQKRIIFEMMRQIVNQ